MRVSQFQLSLQGLWICIREILAFFLSQVQPQISHPGRSPPIAKDKALGGSFCVVDFLRAAISVLEMESCQYNGPMLGSTCNAAP